MEIGMAKWQRWNSNELTSCADSNLGPGCEGRGASEDLPTLKPRVVGRNETRTLMRKGKGGEWVEFCDFEPCPTSEPPWMTCLVFRLEWMEKTVLREMEWSGDECPAFKEIMFAESPENCVFLTQGILKRRIHRPIEVENWTDDNTFSLFTLY
ncbi:hypothetical protein AVEN_14708-1 [Araneus ventricosus]|uniref:Uncharacterized protein n=1 Tax=Araneus ventricosus TaxID=182803 RepID=A0A4Y2UX30_ARAVE|nr:hypothetical protein AVEN_216898-1 [Araneus ventricosus]GBO16316.1 hypothetical protein AVEN_14708-1 [Araneus ventricosus]